MQLRRLLLCCLLICFASPFNGYADKVPGLNELEQNFKNPPMDCWPHTRWWWPGNPVSKEEITWELEQMRQVGIRGVEQITMGQAYEKMDIEFMSEEFLDMISHTIKEAKRLDMEVSLNFGGPGWIIGGPWVPEEDRSKDMVPTSIDLVGPQIYHGPLPDKLTKTQRSWELYHPHLNGDEKVIAVIAGKVIDGRINEQSLINITSFVENKSIEWQVPVGHWKLMVFWLAKNGHSNTVDHFNKGAMERYCEGLGSRFKKVAGDEFGKTLESLFCDSFELPNLASGIYWSTGLMEEFKKFKGYDLTLYLPAVWWEVDDISPKIRYDVNHFLHYMGIEAFYKSFLNWCKANGIKGRIQTYGFTTDNIESAGMTHIPEMEITPGEKDAMPWFDTRIGPKKYVSSGAHIYGRDVVSVEAYTFLHWERYRATLEDLKIATDGFLRSGANKFYNHGYCFLPERGLAPNRRTPWAPQVNPSNVWWKYYPLLTQYIARCSYLFRQGDFAADIAVYSPLANQWTLNVLNPRKWTREFDWGTLGFLLLSNGYDFDLLNDDALQNIAQFENGNINIRNMQYKVLLLPNIQALPLETMQAIEEYVKGGGVVIAFDRAPELSTGFKNYKLNDKKVSSIVGKMFKEPFGMDEVTTVQHGSGFVHWIKHVIDRRIWWDFKSSMLDPFLETIRQYVPPDFGIDFAYEGIRENDGLSYLHRKIGELDVYFVTNVQDRRSDKPITFRVKDKTPWTWDPYSGDIKPIHQFSKTKVGTKIPLNLSSYGSTILVFAPEVPNNFVTQTDLEKITTISGKSVDGLASSNGIFKTTLHSNGRAVEVNSTVENVPAPLHITGNWKFSLSGKDFAGLESEIRNLYSWTDIPETRHVSGVGKYEINFELPHVYLDKNLAVELDLGKVGNIADVELNGKMVGTIWMREQTFNVSEYIKTGTNNLVVSVTNTGINRVSAFTEPVPIPQELVGRFGAAQSKRISREFGFKPLPPSGLMGPVKLTASKKVKIDF